MSDKEVQHLKSRVGDLRRRLRDAELELHEAQVRAAPFQVGDVVVAEGKAAIVREVEPQSWGSCWYFVSFRKKDGAWSNAKKRIFSEPVPASEGDAE